jgi:hypothetical protein
MSDFQPLKAEHEVILGTDPGDRKMTKLCNAQSAHWDFLITHFGLRRIPVNFHCDISSMA